MRAQSRKFGPRTRHALMGMLAPLVASKSQLGARAHTFPMKSADTDRLFARTSRPDGRACTWRSCCGRRQATVEDATATATASPSRLRVAAGFLGGVIRLLPARAGSAGRRVVGLISDAAWRRHRQPRFDAVRVGRRSCGAVRVWTPAVRHVCLSLATDCLDTPVRGVTVWVASHRPRRFLLWRARSQM